VTTDSTLGPNYRVVAYDDRYDSSAFECLDTHLTAYLREGRVRRDITSGQAAVFLMVDEGNRVQGYYTLSAASIDRRDSFSNSQGKQFGYPLVAVTLLGRVAIHSNLRGQGLGTDLIVHALRRASAAAQVVTSYAVVLDAKNEKVAALYRALGFIPLKNQPLRLFLPMKTIDQLA
jgi:predicted GNAT family N-acyltransferase